MLPIIVIGAVFVDRRMLNSPHAGYLPESAVWRVEASDLPGLFSRWNDLNTSASMRRASPALHQNIPLAICRMTGIRPTPGRTRLWLGRTFLLGGDDSGWCLSVRPGIALRLASVLGSPLRSADEDDFWRDYASAWRGGFLLVASSKGYLDTVLAADVPVARTEMADDVLRVSWEGEHAGLLEVAVAEQLPLLFRMKTPADPEAQLRYAAGWHDAMLTVNTHRGAPVAQAALTGLSWAQRQMHPDRAAMLRRLVASWWSAYCPLDLNQVPVGEWAVGIADLDFAPDIPVVESVWAGRTSDPAVSMGQLPTIRQEHRWDDITGWLLPVSGDARTWALAEREGTTFLASHEHRMSALLATARREPEAGVAALNLRWKPAMAALRDALVRAAKDGLLPGYSDRDVRADLVPYVDAFADWGTLQLHAGSDGSGVMGEGWIALGAELVP
jgi:hypothetical protein